MKKNQNLLFFILLVAGTFFMPACNKDACKDVNCGANGICIDGTCECDPGYEGTNCEIESRAKFLGTWTANDNCTSSGTPSYIVTISTSTTNAQSVRIANFWDAFQNAVNATITGNTINIPLQEPDNDDFTVSGSGTINGNTITLTYTVTDTSVGGGTDNCSSTWTK